MDEKCRVCSDPVAIQIMKNTGLCSELCRKVDAGEISGEEWVERRMLRDESSAPQES